VRERERRRERVSEYLLLMFQTSYSFLEIFGCRQDEEWLLYIGDTSENLSYNLLTAGFTLLDL